MNYKVNSQTKIPKNISYRDVIGLSNENIERLEKNQPANLGAAAMLEGITPASINLLRIFITKHKNAQKSPIMELALPTPHTRPGSGG